ncbi:hypothetical protein ACNSO7_00050, partial [Yersinia enterocolitica]|uniref:hypothetical protein n=1 Tax=Yersinia enterocolitica TaxID=630 RepID=UPI003AB51FC7
APLPECRLALSNHHPAKFAVLYLGSCEFSMSEKSASFKLSRKALCSIDSGRMGELSGLIWMRILIA